MKVRSETVQIRALAREIGVSPRRHTFGTWELVEKKLITEDDFRAFVYDNPRGLWLNNNAKFFAGTVLEGGP